MPTLGNALDFAKFEARNLRGHQLGTAPSSPVTGQLYYNTADNTLYWWDGTVWVNARGGTAPDATTSSKGIVQLAGDLAGTAASPQIAAGVITDADVNSANKDGAIGTASMRTLGTGAQQAMAGNTRLDTITAPSLPVFLNGQRLTSVADPSGAQDAANKQYVDNTAQGLDAKASVRCATTASISGGSAPAGAQTIDGIAVANNDRVLVKNQTSPQNNGIYAAVTTGSWNRVTDMDTWTEVPSAVVYVEQGTANADTGWLCTSDQGGTLNTTAIIWRQIPTGLSTGINSSGYALSANTSLDQIVAPAAPVDFNSQRLINVPTPTAWSDAANKTYVDNAIQGLNAKQACRVGSTANLALPGPTSSYSIDGVALANNDRVLAKNQTSSPQNGVYVFQTGIGLSRAGDLDSAPEFPGAYVWVTEGTVNADTGWLCTNDASFVLDSTGVVWVQFASAGSAIAGAGLTKTGNTLDVGAGAGITVAADTVAVAVNGIDNTMLADGAVNLASADVTGTLPVAKGGTGSTTVAGARNNMFATTLYQTSTHSAGTTISISQVTHGLLNGMIVQVFDAATGNEEIPDIKIDPATILVTITYGASVAANSKRIVMVGLS